MEKKKRGILGKIIDIDEDSAIFADKSQYILNNNNRSSYFTSLEACFQFLFEEKVKIRLAENSEKNIKEIIEIHKEVAKWLKSIFRSIENPPL